MANQDSRIRIKRSTTTGEVPTVAPSTDHTDGTWDALDVYVGEQFLNTADDRLWVRTDNGIIEVNTVKSVRLEIPSAEILNMYATPKQFGLNVPTGYAAVPVGDIYMGATYAGVAYATNTSLRIRSVGGANNFVSAVNALAFSADVFIPLTANAVSSGKAVVGDTDWEVYVPAGDPTAGTSNIVIYASYRLVQL